VMAGFALLSLPTLAQFPNIAFVTSVDGFADTLVELLNPNYKVYAPLWMDENGNLVSENAEVWTGTSQFGVVSLDNCTDWTTASSGIARYGSSSQTGTSWTSWGGGNCNGRTGRLYCLQTGPGNPINLPGPPASDDLIAFVAPVGGSADFSQSPYAAPGKVGHAAADSICNFHAAAATHPQADQFKAWLSAGGVNARDRFNRDGPWYRPDGFLIAASMADLTDGLLLTSINQDISGNRLDQGTVWTGSKPDGTVDFTNHCSSWQSAAGNGLFASLTAASGFWSELNVATCDYAAAMLYCLSDFDPDFVSEDGFEG